jgi:hypothetical protein
MSPPRHALAAAWAAAVAAVVTAGGLARVLGLLGGTPVGAGDNGDGFRTFCVAGLLPDNPELNATWRGVVVTAFTTGHPPCSDGVPSSASRILAATVGDGPLWSLTTLAWTYAGVTALGAGIAAAALATAGARRALLVALPLLPLLVVPWWSRFDLSTYAEPAGLVGTVWVLLGLLVVAGTPPSARAARVAALGLVVAGGLAAATAKPGFVPVGVVAALAAVTVAVGVRGGWRARVPGLVAGALVVVLAAGPVLAAVATQNRLYGPRNTHHVVFTVLLPELGPGVLPPLGFPPAAAAASGESWYWAGARDIPGWDAALGSRPDAARAEAQAVLAAHPGLAVRVVGRALSATLRPALPYLPSVPRGSAPEVDEGRTIYPETGPVGDLQRVYLEGITVPWLPSALVVAAVGAALATVVPRRRRRPMRSSATGMVRLAAGSALTAVGIAALAVAGDGFYELTKHVWLASYLLVVTALLLAASGVTAALARLRPDR